MNTNQDFADEKPPVPLPHPWRWVSAAVILIIVIAALISVWTNPNFGWDVVLEYLFNRYILDGLMMTLILTVIAMVIGIILGVILAVMRVSPNPILRGTSTFYIWFFRGTPVLVQLIFWYSLASLYPLIKLGIPGLQPFFEADVNALITPFVAAILGLGLNQGAYMSEIVRSGLIAVDQGQHEAAESVGLSRFHTLRYVVLPQAMRIIIPPTGNETIGMLKATSLVSVIALSDLLYSAQTIYSRTFETIPLLIVASIWYLAATSVLSVGQHYIEKHYGKGASGTPRPGFRKRKTFPTLTQEVKVQA